MPRTAILDLDGTLVDSNYLHTQSWFLTLIRDVEPPHDARELVADLKRLGHTVVLASSATSAEVEHYVDLLGVRDIADAWTTSADVESTKPEPDLIQAAVDRGGNADATMLGDTPHDIEAAAKVKVETVALITGGFSEAELTEAGAVAVHESISHLREGLDESAFGPG